MLFVMVVVVVVLQLLWVSAVQVMNLQRVGHIQSVMTRRGICSRQQQAKSRAKSFAAKPWSAASLSTAAVQ